MDPATRTQNFTQTFENVLDAVPDSMQMMREMAAKMEEMAKRLEAQDAKIQMQAQLVLAMEKALKATTAAFTDLQTDALKTLTAIAASAAEAVQDQQLLVSRVVLLEGCFGIQQQAFDTSGRSGKPKDTVSAPPNSPRHNSETRFHTGSFSNTGLHAAEEHKRHFGGSPRASSSSFSATRPSSVLSSSSVEASLLKLRRLSMEDTGTGGYFRQGPLDEDYSNSFSSSYTHSASSSSPAFPYSGSSSGMSSSSSSFPCPSAPPLNPCDSLSYGAANRVESTSFSTSTSSSSSSTAGLPAVNALPSIENNTTAVESSSSGSSSLSSQSTMRRSDSSAPVFYLNRPWNPSEDPLEKDI